jgi:hypothetical protein
VDLGDGAEAEGGEELGEVGEGVGAGRQWEFDFAAGFCGGVEFWAFVGDEVRISDLAEAEGFVGLREVTRGVVEVVVELVDDARLLRAQVLKSACNRTGIGDTEFLFDFEGHGSDNDKR